MEVNHIFPGVHYIKEGNFSILAGCPPEIIKVLMQKNLSPPDVILLPDVPLARGESQIAVEFPLYHNLFMNPNKDKTKKLVLLGNSIRVESAKKLLKLCLTGLDLEELLEEGMEQSDAERLHNETSWFHLKNSDGTFLTIDDLVLGVVIEDEAVQMEGLQIERISPNNFRISHDTESISICMDVTEEQKPPYPINYDLIPSHLVKYGIEVLGGSTGFSATNASSGLALSHNGNYTLIDAIPYLNYHLKARGIGRNQVFSLFLSHIHDDHCNLLSLLKYNRKIKILTTHIIYRMMLKKLSYVMDRSLEEIEDYFIFVPLKPGETTNYYGVKITPHWSIHSIPTIGARFEVMHMGKNYSVLFTGDTQS
ncbi:MAG: MBL fold metallo-hydrolase [Spirochaetota bacterium]